jgi:hypothetical protein
MKNDKPLHEQYTQWFVPPSEDWNERFVFPTTYRWYPTITTPHTWTPAKPEAERHAELETDRRRRGRGPSGR